MEGQKPIIYSIPLQIKTAEREARGFTGSQLCPQPAASREKPNMAPVWKNKVNIFLHPIRFDFVTSRLGGAVFFLTIPYHWHIHIISLKICSPLLTY